MSVVLLLIIYRSFGTTPSREKNKSFSFFVVLKYEAVSINRNKNKTSQFRLLLALSEPVFRE